MIVVAICSIQCIWISVSPCPQNVDNGNVMGVIERKPPSSFSRRSSSGNGGFEHYHPPVQSFPFASRTLRLVSHVNPSSIQPRSFSLIPFHLPHLPSPPLLSLPSSTTSVSLVPRVALYTIPPPCPPCRSLPSVFFFQPPPTPNAYGATHTVAFRLFHSPLPLSLPLIPEFHPRGEPLRQPLFSSL